MTKPRPVSNGSFLAPSPHPAAEQPSFFSAEDRPTVSSSPDSYPLPPTSLRYCLLLSSPRPFSGKGLSPSPTSSRALETYGGREGLRQSVGRRRRRGRRKKEEQREGGGPFPLLLQPKALLSSLAP